jgi:hypothetical protein
VRATFRPLPAWPYAEQPARAATYKATYSRTLQDLEYEIERLDGSELIIGVVADDSQIRIDGAMRSDAKVRHPGVEVSFEVPGGRRLTFHTDVHKGYANSWQDNLRAVALGLEALRAVSRYGITTGFGEQYAGFAAIGPGGPDPERGRRLVESHGSVAEALKKTHPDHGGDPQQFADVQAYRTVVGAGAR